MRLWSRKLWVAFNQFNREMVGAWIYWSLGGFFNTASLWSLFKNQCSRRFYLDLCGANYFFCLFFLFQIDIRQTHPSEGRTSRDFLEFMLAGAISKTVASCVAYPHEVARTRLREEGDKYRTFWQTLLTVWKEEGKAGLYRFEFSGFLIHLRF